MRLATLTNSDGRVFTMQSCDGLADGVINGGRSHGRLIGWERNQRELGMIESVRKPRRAPSSQPHVDFPGGVLRVVRLVWNHARASSYCATQ